MKFPFFQRQLPREIAQKASAAYALHVMGLGQPVWSTRNYDQFVAEGFAKNVVVYQAITKLATAIATIPWQAWSGDTLLDAHPSLDLLRNPNPLQSGTEFWRAKISFLYLHGNAYDERVVNQGRLLELWTHRPDRMAIIPGSTGLPSAYEYSVNQKRVRYGADPVTGDSDIRHLRLFNPTSDFYGMSPITAGAHAIDQHNEAMNWMQSLLQNSARPSGALVVPAETRLSDQQFTQLKQDIENIYSGAANGGRPMLLEGGMDWKQLGLSPDDMNLISTKDSAARDISLAFGVPPLLLNIPGDNTFSNYREARLGFYEDTVIPLARYMADEMNAWLAPYWGGVAIRPNVDAIPAVAERKKESWEMVDSSDELTVNEARAMKGYPELSDERGDMLLADLRASTRGHDTDEEGGQDAPSRLPGA